MYSYRLQINWEFKKKNLRINIKFQKPETLTKQPEKHEFSYDGNHLSYNNQQN
jgi:hypothetical protein